MEKPKSPVYLGESLMTAATVAGHILHRSPADQIEYWTDLGRKVADVVDPYKLLAVSAGFSKIEIEDMPRVSIDPDAVFEMLERDQKSGALAGAIPSASLRY